MNVDRAQGCRFAGDALGSLVEIDQVRSKADFKSFLLLPNQWTESTGAVGLISKAGRYGVTYAHGDIAFEFASIVGGAVTTGGAQ